jgi:hypothetical protein
MVQTGRSSPTLAGVDDNLLFDGEGMERQRAGLDVVLPVPEVSPSISTEQTTILTQDNGGDETTPPVILTPDDATKDVAPDGWSMLGAADGADVPLGDAGVSVQGEHRPSWNALVAGGESMVEEVPAACATMTLGPLDSAMDCEGAVMPADSDRVGEEGRTCEAGATAVGVEQSATRHDSARRKVPLSDAADGESHPPFRPVSPNKPKKLKVERAPPPTRTRSQAHGRVKL